MSYNSTNRLTLLSAVAAGDSGWKQLVIDNWPCITLNPDDIRLLKIISRGHGVVVTPTDIIEVDPATGRATYNDDPTYYWNVEEGGDGTSGAFTYDSLTGKASTEFDGVAYQWNVEEAGTGAPSNTVVFDSGTGKASITVGGTDLRWNAFEI